MADDKHHNKPKRSGIVGPVNRFIVFAASVVTILAYLGIQFAFPRPSPALCGQTIGGTFNTTGEIVSYPINLSAGDSIVVQGRAATDQLAFNLGLRFEDGEWLASYGSASIGDGLWARRGDTSTTPRATLIDSNTIPLTGTYIIEVRSREGSNGRGDYTLEITCNV